MAKLSDLNLLDVGNTIQLVGAIWHGEGKMYLCMFPESNGGLYDEANAEFWFGDDGEGGTAEVETLNMDSEEWNKFIKQTDLLETEVLSAAGEDGKLAKIIIRKSARNIAQNVSWEVYDRDGYKCRYCGVGPGIPLTVDHLVLWEEGGPNLHANLVTADKRCNRKRGNLPYDQWLEHPYYKKVSANLTEEQREANRKLAATLAAIPRMLHKPSKRK
jgi:HNH endonuclease